MLLDIWVCSCPTILVFSIDLELNVGLFFFADLFWSFTDSAYNTIFKLLFIFSSAYTIYLMLNDYKPTHDPNIDTFKVQYLLGASALLGLLFPYKYTFSEVCFACLWGYCNCPG
jgi:ER lumen protein retaining receptor